MRKKYARNPEIVIIHSANPPRGRSAMKKSRRKGRKTARNHMLRVRQGGKLRTMKSLRKRLGRKKAKAYFRKHPKYHGRKLITGGRRACKATKHSTKRKAVKSASRKARKGGGKRKGKISARNAFVRAQWKAHNAMYKRMGFGKASAAISKLWKSKH